MSILVDTRVQTDANTKPELESNNKPIRQWVCF
jgi:hypothetical protein